jgi:hypothetical protein
MLALSVQQPWASLIVLGIKRCENRTWATDHRGPLAIHASGRCVLRSWAEILDGGDDVPPDEEVALEGGIVLPALASLPLGAVVGTVDLVDCLPLARLPRRLRSSPFVSGPWCWLLEDARPLASPVACKGRLRLWECPL